MMKMRCRDLYVVCPGPEVLMLPGLETSEAGYYVTSFKTWQIVTELDDIAVVGKRRQAML